MELYTAVPDIWEAMYAACADAQRSIEFQQYILADDKIGRRFLALLADKARAGVDVRVMVDSIGSRDLFLSPAFAALRQAGARTYFYNPIRLLTPSLWLPRNHTKILLVDGVVCYTGSVCIWDDTAGWHDLQVRLTGPVIAEVQRDFSRLWAQAGRERVPTISNGHAQRGAFFYLVSQFGPAPNRIYRELLRAMRNAKKSILIVTPYFLPPWLLRRAMRRAARRGVEVRVMVSENSDVAIADHVSHSYYPRLLRHGVRIFHYQKGVMHAKYVVIDDDWATIGSVNMDFLSLLRNREANVFMTDPAAVALVRADFEACLQACREVDMDYYRSLPWWQRVQGRLGRYLKRIL